MVQDLIINMDFVLSLKIFYGNRGLFPVNRGPLIIKIVGGINLNESADWHLNKWKVRGHYKACQICSRNFEKFWVVDK